MENIQNEPQTYSEYIGFVDILTVVIIILILAFFAILTNHKPASTSTKASAPPNPPANNLDSTIVFRDLNERVLFETGSAVITKEFEQALDTALVNIQKNFHKGSFNFVQVVGHTDQKPIRSHSTYQKYIDNWDLGAARAAAVVRYFTDPHHPNHLKVTEISVVSFGEFSPISSDATPESDARNRRIEIIMMKRKIS